VSDLSLLKIASQAKPGVDGEAGATSRTRLTLAGRKGATVFYWVSRQQSIRNRRRVVRHRTDPITWQSGSLGCEAFVAMVQTTDLRNCDHVTSGAGMNWTRSRTVLQQRQMRAGLMVVVSVRGEDAT